MTSVSQFWEMSLHLILSEIMLTLDFFCVYKDFIISYRVYLGRKLRLRHLHERESVRVPVGRIGGVPISSLREMLRQEN
jgi:hypothetical protein